MYANKNGIRYNKDSEIIKMIQKGSDLKCTYTFQRLFFRK